MLPRGSTLDTGLQAPTGILACTQELLAPGRPIGVLARLRARRLDQRLAEGADPRSSALLAARAAQLTRPQVRTRIAAGLERMALSLDQPPTHFAIAPLRGAVAVNRSRLFEVAATLRSRSPVYAGGIAGARLIVIDGTGPAFTDRRGEGLARQLELAREQLLGRAGQLC
jgi:hypothetical protein